MRIGTTNGDLFLDVRGDAAAPPLLYLHGGPGMGCREFMNWQGDRLAVRLRVVGLDQRGVLRSDPLGVDARLDEEDLVDDCESLREWLGIGHWAAVLGHSFGGRIALRYAVRHPQAVDAVMFENPCWDMREADRGRLLVAADIYQEEGDQVTATRCREAAAGPLDDRWETVQLMGGLFRYGRYFDMHARSQENRDILNRLGENNPLPAEQQARADDHRRLLMESGDLMDSTVPMLAKLSVPALLIRGGYDQATGPVQQAAFRELVPDGVEELFERSGHFVQLEEPDRYARLVTAFALRHRRR